MPWKRSEPMVERAQFVAAVELGEFCFAECCRRFGISRKTGYKLWSRYQAEGVEGLHERSRAPLQHAGALSAAAVARIVACKHARPHWGPRKLRVALAPGWEHGALPAISTIGEVLGRHGLVRHRRARLRVPPASTPLGECRQANDLWSADFKGQFRLGNREWCYPFTLSDNYSRYLLACRGQSQPTEAGVRRCCEAAFRDYGLPWAIRTDNGSPFASTALAGLTRLSVWWIKLGIRPERIGLGQPQQNGRHERMHKTLKAEATRPAASGLRQQQRRLDAFRREYNEPRPHEALGDRTPATVHQRSARTYPSRLPSMEYDRGREVRTVRSNGTIRWRGQLLFLSEALVHERVALAPISDERWQLCFGSWPLAVVDDRLGKIIRLD